MRKIIIFALFAFILTGCTASLSTLQRRSIESKNLTGKFDNAYKATLQVFQDHGYIIKNSDYQSGVIRGETGIKQIWFSMINFEITATIEQFGKNTVKERISLIRKTKSSSQYGTQENSQIVENPELFQQLYDEIQKEIFTRDNLNK